jgi:hypothetical protein
VLKYIILYAAYYIRIRNSKEILIENIEVHISIIEYQICSYISVGANIMDPRKYVPSEANYGLALLQYAAQPNQGCRMVTDGPPEGGALTAQYQA